ncbi:MAG: OmpA family protein [Acidobacteria bacterium]|nr:OmpA family protein [Acidobacteriota bacterium]
MRVTATVAMVLGATLLGGCIATTGFVEDTAAQLQAQVGAQISEMRRDVDDSEAIVQQQAARIDAVEQTAQNAFVSANTAQMAAEMAQRSADQLGNTIENANRRLVYEMVIDENVAGFGISQSVLPDEVRAYLDQFVADLRTLPIASHVEIEGHTDATGSPANNSRLGMERANNTRRYLHEAHQLPLHKISIISYGEDQPVAPNDTAEGRAQNRRVVLRVLA